MANTAQIGNYQLTLESRGLWVSCKSGGSREVVRPFLSFHLKESGNQEVPFELQRLYQSSQDAAEVHGSFTDRIAFDALIKPCPHQDGFVVDFRINNATDDMNIRVIARLTLNGEADPRWLVPGFFYGNNKPPGCTRLFPAYSDTNRDPKRLVSNYWSFRSDRASVPLTSVWTYGAYTWMLADGNFGRTKENPRGVGITGLHLGSEDGHPTLGVEFPYQEAPVKFSYCHEDKMEKEEIFLFLPQNIPMIGSFQLGLADPELHAYDKVIRGFYKEFSTLHPTKARMAPEWSEHTAHTGLLRWHYDGRSAAIWETVAFDRPLGKRPGPGERTHMHAGWQSGILPAYALLWAGRETKHAESVTAGTAIINKFTHQLSPSGTIFPVWTEEHGWSCSYGPEEGCAHARTTAEAVLFIIRAISMELTHNSNHPQWCEAVLSTLNYAMGSQREDGAFPVYYDLATGSPKQYDGSGGIAWAAAAAAGAALTGKSHYREIAQRAGHYYEKFIHSEFLFGSVEDQYMVPTAEDCHWAVITYVMLYELERDAKWLMLARKAADLAITWRFAYNVVFSPESMLGRHDFRSRGGDICSVATPLLGSYGLLSYHEFLKLAAYTGDEYYLERAEDARAFATQLIAREEGQLNARSGMVAGNVFHTDWLQPKGMLTNQSHCMTAAVIKYAELTRRNLNLSRLTYEASRSEQLAEEIKITLVNYADVALSEELGLGEISPASMPVMGSSDRVSGLVRRPQEMTMGRRQSTGFSPGNKDFFNKPVSPGEDPLAGLSKELGIPKGRPATNGGFGGGRPATKDGNRGVSRTTKLPPPSSVNPFAVNQPLPPAAKGPQPAGQPHASRPQSQFGPIPGTSVGGIMGARPVAPPPTGPNGPGSQRLSGLHRPPSNFGQNPNQTGASPDVTRAMTNALSSALGLSSSQPSRHDSRDSSMGSVNPPSRTGSGGEPVRQSGVIPGESSPQGAPNPFGGGFDPFSQQGPAGAPPRPANPSGPEEEQKSSDEIKYKIF